MAWYHGTCNNWSMKSLVAVAALFLLAGCSGTSNVYYVDERFSPEEEQAISAANDMWCVASRNALCMDLVFGAHVDVSETSRNAIVRTGERGAQYRFRSWVERKSTAAFHHPAGSFDSSLIVVFHERVALENLRVAVAHEMGHAFGIAGHVDDPSAIMYGNLDGAADKYTVTCADLAAVGMTCGSH